jgi:hypothetical protein
MQTQIHQFSNTDRQWLSQSLERGRAICTFYLKEKAIDAAALDQVFALWASSPESARKFSADEIANGLGSLFGELLHRHLNFGWCRIEDRHGNETALLDETTGSIVMPVNAVHKRIEPDLQNQAFFVAMWQMIAAHLEKTTSRPEE